MAGHPSVKKRQKELARKERRDEKAVKRDQRRVERNNGPERAVDEFGNPIETVEAALDEFGNPIEIVEGDAEPGGEPLPDASIEGAAPAAPVDP